MKVEREEPSFVPVVITLESQDELDWLLACLNVSRSRASGQFEGALEYVGDHSDRKLSSEAQYEMWDKVVDLYIKTEDE